MIAPAATRKPFWEKDEVDAARERINAKLAKVKPADYVRVSKQGTVLAVVDGIVYYNTPSHREDELGI